MVVSNPETVPAMSESRFVDHASFRDGIVRDLRRQLFGPDRNDSEQERGELLSVSPLQLYATGILFPQGLVQDLLEGAVEPEEQQTTVSDVNDTPEIKESRRQRGGEADAGSTTVEREPLNLANEFSPAACGISFRLAAPTNLQVSLTYGTYNAVKHREPHPRAGQTGIDGRIFPAFREVPAYQRVDHQVSIPLRAGDKIGSLEPIPVSSTHPDLRLHVTNRRRSDGSIVTSVMLVNHKVAKFGAPTPHSDAFFQIDFEIRHPEGTAVFLPIDRDAGSEDSDDELASLDLLYRHRRAFALGHGMAGDWNRDETMSESGRTDMVRTAALPTYELKPIKAREVGLTHSDLNLRMRYLYDADGASDPEQKIIRALEVLAEDYRDWITATKGFVTRLEANLRRAAESNLAKCDTCLRRISRGIEVLKSNPRAMTAFRLMNRAMLMQQFHSNAFRFRELGTSAPKIPEDYRDLPGGDRKWRPFQLAFILMNVAAMSDPEDQERSIVDLIWFPTGGGKTEAYLGLAAFTICLERMSRKKTGVVVLMRYTLRLLTAQQFQRASALILALEVLRQDKTLNADLGSEPLSIGLWVGQGLSPNKRADARAALTRLQQNRFADNPFQVLQCPWCGVQFNNPAKLGYVSRKIDGSQERRVRFVCPDDACRFGGASKGLPIEVVDEEIYETPPTVVIGTVDKFAQVAWDERVGRLFGLGIDLAPPALVIQDELHLISGPLGTIVGLYETAIDRFCSRDGHTHKIVVSTATIRRARQQCFDLYAREAFEFPPQAERAGESYFALEDKKSDGRLYVGFLGSAVKSHQTALVRACSPLLQSACSVANVDDEAARSVADPYGTLVWYFNSLRELGHAATLCVGDIPEFLKGLRHRLNIPFENSRYIREIVELTSRRNADEIPAILQQLEIPWRLKPEGQPAVDVLLATNMVAVGVDVARLGLMVMSGQPKSTSEYIQATSRVGRSYPGLVVTV